MDLGGRQSFRDDALKTLVVWNYFKCVHLLKALKHPSLIAFFGIQSRCSDVLSKIQPVFITETGKMRLANKSMAEN